MYRSLANQHDVMRRDPYADDDDEANYLMDGPDPYADEGMDGMDVMDGGDAPAAESANTKKLADMPKVPNDTNLNRLSLAKEAPNDQPFGVANIIACLALAVAIADETARANLLGLLGLLPGEFPTLKNPCRKTMVLVSEIAARVLPESEMGKQALKAWSNMGADQLELAGNVEDQVNKLVMPFLELTTPPFAPGSLVGEEIPLLVLIAMEMIKVKHLEVLPKYTNDKFKHANRTLVDAKYAHDPKRSMPYLHIPARDNLPGLRICQLKSKPDEFGIRSLLFLLPDDENQTELNDTLDALRVHMDAEGGLNMPYHKELDFMFPCFDATFGVDSIVEPLQNCGLVDVFDAKKKPFETALPQFKIEGDTPAFVSAVKHMANFKADRKGAEAKAVTVAVVATYRSLSVPAPPEKFHCDRPFVVLLVDGEGDKMNIEFALKIAGGCLDLTPED